MSVIFKFLFILLTIQKEISPYSPRASPVGAHTARRRAREMLSDSHQRANQIDRIGAAAEFLSPYFRV